MGTLARESTAALLADSGLPSLLGGLLARKGADDEFALQICFAYSRLLMWPATRDEVTKTDVRRAGEACTAQSLFCADQFFSVCNSMHLAVGINALVVPILPCWRRLRPYMGLDSRRSRKAEAPGNESWPAPVCARVLSAFCRLCNPGQHRRTFEKPMNAMVIGICARRLFSMFPPFNRTEHPLCVDGVGRGVGLSCICD